jgi:hypothetical protein
MQTRMQIKLISIVGLVLLATAVGGVAPIAAGGPTIFATGLNNPRGLAFDENGNLYVAEGGTGGSTSTVGQCLQAAGAGPYSGGFTGRISKISRNGTRTTLASRLPSSQTSPAIGSLVSGVADVGFADEHQLFALISGAGCSHGLNGTSNSIVRVHRNGSTSIVANLSAFIAAHPVANPDTGDFEPDGTWYSFVAADDGFYAVNPNGQELDRISEDGHVSRVVDFSVTFPGTTDWRGPTAIVRHGRFLYVGTLTTFPSKIGAAQVFKVDPRNGTFSVYASNLTTVLGLAFGHDGGLYVLEMSVKDGGPAPGTGEVVRIKGDERTTIASGLNFPTGMALGPGGVYVSVNGFGGPPGAGKIVKIPFPEEGED